MSICAKPDELPKLRICVRDFGNRLMLATESRGATIVLTAHRDSFKSCDENGILTVNAARPILERMCKLWNEAIKEEGQ